MSRKPLKISKNFDVKFEDLQIWFCTCFRYLSRFFFNISKKLFLKKALPGARVIKHVLTWIEIRLKHLSKLGFESLPWTAQSGLYFPKIRGGWVFFDIFRAPVSQKTVRYTKMLAASKVLKYKRPTKFTLNMFSISLPVFEIYRTRVYQKQFGDIKTDLEVLALLFCLRENEFNTLFCDCWLVYTWVN